MKVLLVMAHPCHDSYTRLRGAAVRGLSRAGHTIDTLDLYAVGFQAQMTREARRARVGAADPRPDDRRPQRGSCCAGAIVFVYPTWWSGLPAVLKGWLERVMVPGVGFTLDEQTRKVSPGWATSGGSSASAPAARRGATSSS